MTLLLFLFTFSRRARARMAKDTAGGECEVTSDYDYDEEGGDDTDLLKKHDVGRWAARKQLARHLGRSQDPGLHEIDDCDEREDAKQCADKNDKRPSFSPPL